MAQWDGFDDPRPRYGERPAADITWSKMPRLAAVALALWIVAVGASLYVGWLLGVWKW